MSGVRIDKPARRILVVYWQHAAVVVINPSNLKNTPWFYSLADMRSRFGIGIPSGRSLRCFLDRHLRVVHAVWMRYGRHCCNVPLMLPVL